MKKTTWIVALAITAAAVSCKKDVKETTQNPASQDFAPQVAVTSTATTGNGAPSGAHYTLNIIGMEEGKTADMTNNNGHRIFVNLWGRTDIKLANADLTDGTFKVLDANGTDQNGALFQLPSADLDNDGLTKYSVYARSLGKPGGSATMTTCATDPTTLEEVCSLESYVALREKGGSKFENVSRELLYIYADLDGDGSVERVPLFDDRLEDYYWKYENSGLRLLQLRFYDIPTNVN